MPNWKISPTKKIHEEKSVILISLPHTRLTTFTMRLMVLYCAREMALDFAVDPLTTTPWNVQWKVEISFHSNLLTLQPEKCIICLPQQRFFAIVGFAKIGLRCARACLYTRALHGCMTEKERKNNHWNCHAQNTHTQMNDICTVTWIAAKEKEKNKWTEVKHT